ncbi:VOC family protein [Paenibacillus piri]|nr:VOC family protein [Paenibacillus piri]
MITELNHVGIVAGAVEENLNFYVDILGGKVVNEGYIEASNTKCIYVQLASGIIELLCRGNEKDRVNLGLNHVCFLTDDLDGDYEKLLAAGFVFTSPPKVAGSGDGRLTFLTDSIGTRVELIQRDQSYKNPKVEGRILSFDHISLSAHDLQAAESFYTEKMGMKELKRMRVDATDLTMVYLNYGEDVIELLNRPNQQPVSPPIGHIALRVDNVDEMGEYLASRGVEILQGFPKQAGTGIGRITMVKDPNGARIEFVDRKDLREL